MMAVPQQEGQETQLISPLHKATVSNYCLTFGYVLYGSGAGQLSVSILYSSGVSRQVLEMFGDQGLEWKTTKVSLSGVSEDFQLVFTSRQGSTEMAPAVDDIYVSEGKCSFPGWYPLFHTHCFMYQNLL